MKKKKGEINFVVSFIAIISVLLSIYFIMTIKKLDFIRNSIEDSLVASNLAASTIDLKEYGATNKILINDFDKSFKDFKDSLKINLNLDESYICKSKSLSSIVSPIQLSVFRIYNVDGNNINIITKNRLGEVTKTTGQVGNVITPDGVFVKDTTVYSKVDFKIKSVFNKEVMVSKEKSVDITNKKED